MFRKALIAVDLDCQSPLLECARDLRTWGIDQLLLLHVPPVGYRRHNGHANEEHYRKRLAEHAEILRASGFRVEARLHLDSDISGSITGLASDSQSDLLVLGSRSQNFMSQPFLGSVARNVLRRSRVPVLIHQVEPTAGSAPVRCTTCTSTLRHVLLATDLTSGSRAAHDVVLELAVRGARVDSTHIAESSELVRFPGWKSTSRSVLEALVRRITSAGGTGEVLEASGDPCKQVQECASRLDASLLVIGKRGRHSTEYRTLGSTAKALCKSGRVPVLMVPNRSA